jgi:glycolate oxidase FAD binding subunit
MTRPAEGRDAIQGVQPERVISPDTPEAAAAVLQALGESSASVVIRGAGTKLDWGRVPKPFDTVLDLSRMNRVLVHEHGDMTATLEGGASIAAVNATLAQHGQWLPVDGGFSGATIGGMLASGDSGPLRHRFGTLRDLIIGVRIATPGGDLVHAGGRVVKNVAGYDLGKLLAGSQGSLAAAVSATFKLSPVLPPSTTLVAHCDELSTFAAAVARVKESQLEPIAFDVRMQSATDPRDSGRFSIVIRFASTPRAVDAATNRASELLVGGTVEMLTGDAERTLWTAQATGAWAMPGAVVRLSWASASLPALGELLQRVTDDGVEFELTGRAAVGAGLLRLVGTPDQLVSIITRLRGAAPVVGAVTLLRAGSAVKQQIDPWDDLGSSRPTLEAIKRAFDPGGTLNAGRGPV